MIKNYEEFLNENIEFDNSDYTVTRGIPREFLKRMAQLIAEAKPRTREKQGFHYNRELQVEFSEEFPAESSLCYHDVSLNIFAEEEVRRKIKLGDINYFYAQEDDGTWSGGYEEMVYPDEHSMRNDSSSGSMTPYEFLEALANESIIKRSACDHISSTLHREFPGIKPAQRYGV